MWLQFIYLLLTFTHCYSILTFVPKNLLNTNLQITLTNGVIQGSSYESEEYGTFYGYQGIPYAAPPLKELRFKSPQPPSEWDGVLNATVDRDYCAQYHNGYTGSEDCLYINIYTKSTNVIEPLPVMVWIYGGAFFSGNSKKDMWGPEYLLQKDVIVVTFNYRVGIFGFLSTEDMASPGNYGLKDQIAALQFVNQNIHLFGGNNESITIFGESAGAVSVSYLVLAPKAQGLFQSAISESGTVLCPWGFQRNPKNIAFQIGFGLGIATLDSHTLIKRLREIPYDVLLTISTSAIVLNAITPLNGLVFSPTIEPIHEDAILMEGSYELLKKGRFNRVPYIIGFNSEESSVLQEMIDYMRPYLITYDIFPTALIPSDMNVPKMALSHYQVGNKIKTYYFGLVAPSKAPMDNILKYVSDTQFVKPILETVRIMSQFIPVYLYQFSYEGQTAMESVNLDKLIKGTDRLIKGVGHSEEMWYLWKRQNITINDYDELKSNLFITLWANFAKYRNPTPINDSNFGDILWTPSTASNNFKYLDIGPQLNVYVDPKNETMKFWENLYAYYGRGPFDTY